MSQPTARSEIPFAARAPKRSGRGWIGWIIFLIVAVLLFFALQKKPSTGAEIPISEFTTQLSSGNVSQVVVDGDTLRGRFVTPQALGSKVVKFDEFHSELPPGTSQSWTFIQWLLDHRQEATVRVENNSNLVANLIVPLIPWLLIFGFIWFFLFRQLRTHQPDPKPSPVYIVNSEKP
jgi:ATP-dependent Zn protease